MKLSKYKILTAFTLIGMTILSTAAINKIISSIATNNELYKKKQNLRYNWRLGNISYSKSGKGKPILLIHDIIPSSSKYEWHKLENELTKSRTVYSINLLGCGDSEKPDITYTNFLYVQLISDFIKNVIGHRTDVITSGSSASVAIMACHNDDSLFNKIILINPNNLSSFNKTTNSFSKIYKFILDAPVIGTLIYNISQRKSCIHNDFKDNYFFNSYAIRDNDINFYHESAHIGGHSTKKLYTSMVCNYLGINITHALSQINNSITIIGGSDEYNIDSIISEYKEKNPSIESIKIKCCKHLPQLEAPVKLSNILYIYLS
jgi:hypothetical protein